MLENIKNNSIVICSNDTKFSILKNINKLLNIKFMNIEEFIKSYYFSYDEKAILYLIKKYNIKYETALEYLDNLIYVEDKTYNNDKLDFLVKIKKELTLENLLITNNKFKNFIKNKEIIVYNYSLSKFERYLLKSLNIKEINKEQNNYIPDIYKFETKEEEVDFVAHEISHLINDGVDINNIKLTNVTSDYINTINKIFNFYNLKIDKFNNIPIISNIVGKTFYDNLDNGIQFALSKIESYNTTDTYNKIINICNKYVWCDDTSDLKILIDYELNHTYIDNIKYTNMIEVVDYKTYDFKSDYVFMLGFNQGIIPKTYKDEDYINDSIKPNYIDTTIDKNKKEKIDTINIIKNIKNLTITYKLKDNFNTYYKSSLIEELNTEVKEVENDYKTSYSELNDEITLAYLLDDLVKYGTKSNTLNLLSSNYTIPYNTYSHAFTGLNKDKLIKYIESNNTFNLSYTLMDNYNRCSFRFYIDKILCLKKDIDRFSVTLGNLSHYILQKLVKNDIDIKEEAYNFIKENNIELTNSDKFFIEKTIENLKYIKIVLDKQKSFSSLNHVETEKFVKVHLKDNINFVGFIDKIVYDTIDNTKIGAIIDYKTYVKKPSLKYIESGIDMQLAVYMYLASIAYKDINYAGFYLQNILFDNKSLEEKENSLKLIGFTNKDKNILKYFDKSYEDSSVINGVKVKNDGEFTSNSLKHMLTKEEIDEVIDKIEIKIKEVMNNILESKFDINPKYDKENIGCEFCIYKDLCFMKEYDFVNIKKDNKFEELE